MTSKAARFITQLMAEIAERDARIAELEADIVYLKSAEKERNALRAELAALKAGQGEAVAVAWIHPNYLGPNMQNWAFEASRFRLSPEQVPLYTAPPASADAVSVPRELAGRLTSSDNHVRQTARRELRVLIYLQEVAP